MKSGSRRKQRKTNCSVITFLMRTGRLWCDSSQDPTTSLSLTQKMNLELIFNKWDIKFFCILLLNFYCSRSKVDFGSTYRGTV